MDTVAIIVLIACVAVVAIALGLVLYQRRRSSALREEFGGEYDHARRRAGGVTQAERELERRRKRVDALSIRPLSREQSERYSSEWRDLQARFVDEPMPAIRAADDLLNQVMMARGYPVGDFERSVEDLSVDHAPVMAKYRKAHGIAMAPDAGVEPETEQVRQAFVSYRAVFEELLDTKEPEASVPEESIPERNGSRKRAKPSMQH